jgi:hypothetical protein
MVGLNCVLQVCERSFHLPKDKGPPIDIHNLPQFTQRSVNDIHFEATVKTYSKILLTSFPTIRTISKRATYSKFLAYTCCGDKRDFHCLP